ncbi:unnamed protein product [Tetraodon nigroviridis]|uniref:(spotted green pufferfish) hypothetical protein n=1 Tax=Tetraodon nigroviridis TaxID=99883 RepID=Q4SJT3_TETNG|nr:unnamed protein product [Tetraodon nigroviridis]
MVVPDSCTVDPQPVSGSPPDLMESSKPGCEEQMEGLEELEGVELEEVRKLQELVRRLEVQNETLRSRGSRKSVPREACSETSQRLSIPRLPSEHNSADFCSPRDRCSGQAASRPRLVGAMSEEEVEEEEACLDFGDSTYSNGGEQPGGERQTPESPSQGSYESETLAESDSGLDQTALDEVDVLNLEDEYAEEEDEDSWLDVSPKKQVADPGPESPLKWCRQALDQRSPETEMACRTLISRLDQRVPSALSSQSSIDSELSTSDDSISMGYKLQDLTDVQIMARLQEESLRQDYASSSASASRRSSSASLQSLRRGGTYSDQEFDSYSLEDEEDEFCSVPPRRHRFTPSPLGSPRCISPSTSNHGQEYGGRLGAPRTRAPRRSLQGPSAELLKFAKSEEELRRSMPNLAPRTSLRSLEAVKNSRSMEANLQSSGNRMSHLTPSPSTGMSSSRLRNNGQSPPLLRAPVKAVGPVGPSRLPAVHAAPSGGARRMQIQPPAAPNGGAYLSGRASSGSGRPAVSRGPAVPSSSTRTKLSQPPRRSMGMAKISDESWKEGCY